MGFFGEKQQPSEGSQDDKMPPIIILGENGELLGGTAKDEITFRKQGSGSSIALSGKDSGTVVWAVLDTKRNGAVELRSKNQEHIRQVDLADVPENIQALTQDIHAKIGSIFLIEAAGEDAKPERITVVPPTTKVISKSDVEAEIPVTLADDTQPEPDWEPLDDEDELFTSE